MAEIKKTAKTGNEASFDVSCFGFLSVFGATIVTSVKAFKLLYHPDIALDITLDIFCS